MNIADPSEPRDARPAARPGLAKAKLPPLLRSRTLHLLSGSDPRWAGLFEAADIVSEGAPRGVDPERVYYGSTNILLVVDLDRDRGARDPAHLARVAALDPHLRVRALRAARREAAQRACGPLGTISAEISMKPHPRGLTIHVELEGRVLPDRRLTPRAPKNSLAAPESPAALTPAGGPFVGDPTPAGDRDLSPGT